MGLQEVALAADDEATRGDEHTRGRRLRHLISVHPVDLAGDLGLPARTVTHLKCRCLIQTQSGYSVARRVLDDANSCTVQLRMHEEVMLVHVALHESLVLLSIATANHQIVLTGDEPDELLEPENLTLNRANLRLLKLLKVTRCSLFSLLNSH